MTGNDNAMVLYAQNAGLDISRCMMDVQTPISKLEIETRIVVDEYMFAGGFRDLELDTHGILGFAYARLFEELRVRQEQEPSFSDKVLKRIFGEKAPRSCIEHEGKRYCRKWGVANGESRERILWYNEHTRKAEIQKELIGKLKLNISTWEHTLVSNELLLALFSPLLPPLEKLFYEMARF